MGELQQQLVKVVEKMPAFPSSVHKVLSITADINCAPKDLVRVIDHDPVMTMKILKLVNSAYFGLSRRIVSINHAVVFVGINTVKNLAIAIATLGILPQKNRTGMDMNRFLLHSVGCATISRMLARRVGISEPDSTDFFVAGLLHDFGKVVFVQFMPLEYQKIMQRAATEHIPLIQAEQEMLDTNHCTIGAMLGEKWQLPTELVNAISFHHHEGDDYVSSPILDCVVAANQAVKRLDFGCGGNPLLGNLPPAVTERLGMDLTEMVASLEGLTAELERAKVFTRV